MFFLYNHGGSENHGCEALIRTVCDLFGDKKELTLISESPQQDFYYNIHYITEIQSAVRIYHKFSLAFIYAYFQLKFKQDYFFMDVLPYRKSIDLVPRGSIEISVGGDIYCYEDYPKFIKLHQMICNRNCKTILLGCSLEPELFQDRTFVEDMMQYDYISARESLTYRLLQDAGIKHIGCAPDSAFLLPKEYLPLPDAFNTENTIGINVSPLVIKKEVTAGIVLENFKQLIQYILKSTTCSIALIPHVVWKSNDDRIVLKKLFNFFDGTGRVCLIDDCNCMQLKGYISRCRFFIGARTHATIAAYSTCVPTLVLGYSIKSRGIATDLFGTDKNYVVPVQQLQKEDDLIYSFKWIMNHEEEIRKRLNQIMPEYIEKARTIKKNVMNVIGEDENGTD